MQNKVCSGSTSWPAGQHTPHQAACSTGRAHGLGASMLAEFQAPRKGCHGNKTHSVWLNLEWRRQTGLYIPMVETSLHTGYDFIISMSKNVLIDQVFLTT